MAKENLVTKSVNTFSHFVWRSMIFILIFVLFTTNLIALALSQQCNRSEPIFFRMASGMFAFMFGILYILVNYYYYRLVLKANPCRICAENPFK